MDGLTTQLFYDGGNVVILEEADGGDARSSDCEAGVSVLQSDPPECENRDVGEACFVERLETGGRRIFFFKDGAEHGEGCGAGRGFDYFCRRVTGDRDQGCW